MNSLSCSKIHFHRNRVPNEGKKTLSPFIKSNEVSLDSLPLSSSTLPHPLTFPLSPSKHPLFPSELPLSPSSSPLTVPLPNPSFWGDLSRVETSGGSLCLYIFTRRHPLSRDAKPFHLASGAEPEKEKERMIPSDHSKSSPPLPSPRASLPSVCSTPFTWHNKLTATFSLCSLN